MPSDLKLHPLYKTALMLVLVSGPFIWLAFTEDGQRRTDVALMALLGKPDLNAAIDAFSGGLTEQQFRTAFPKLDLQCTDGPNPFGDRRCVAEVGAFNGIPVSSFSLFLADERLRAAKLSYRRAYHEALRRWVEGRVGVADPAPAAPGTAAAGEGVAVWALPEGLLLMRDGALAPDDEPALLWLSRASASSATDPIPHQFPGDQE
jgi:hypothetical protein